MSIEPLWVGVGAAVLAAAVAVLLLVARTRRLAGRLDEQQAELQALRRDLEAVGNGSLAALERLDRTEPAVEQLAERVGAVELTLPARPYEQAAEAVRGGAGRDELIGRLRLTPAEADLILAIHRPGRGDAGV